jgi:hypothetical protein
VGGAKSFTSEKAWSLKQAEIALINETTVDVSTPKSRWGFSTKTKYESLLKTTNMQHYFCL